MWIARMVQRHWLNTLIWALVAVGGLLLLSALERHGIRVFNRRGDVVGDTVRAYLLALAPLWGAAVLHLLRQRPH
jgi:hypothetical protein